jgi:hypothetical protein
MQFENPNENGGGVAMHSCVGGLIQACDFGCRGIALATYNSQSIKIDVCTVIGSRKVGIQAGNATEIVSTDVTGCGVGIQHENLGLVVQGGRQEMNNISMMLGVHHTAKVTWDKGLTPEGWAAPGGTPVIAQGADYGPNDKAATNGIFQSGSVDISGVSLERNQCALYARACSGLHYRTSNITGGELMNYGIYMHDVEEVVFAAFSVSGAKGFAKAGIFINNPKYSVMMGVMVSKDMPMPTINNVQGVRWRLPIESYQRAGIQIMQCNETQQ